MLSADENPTLNRPPRMMSSPLLNTPNSFTPSKKSAPQSVGLNIRNDSPTAGFFSPTAATPRQYHQSGMVSPMSDHGDFDGEDAYYKQDPSRSLNYGFADSDEFDGYQNETIIEVGVNNIQQIDFDSLHGTTITDDNAPTTQRHIRAASVSSLSDDQSDGSSITVRNLEVWNKFFENAMKSGESKKLAMQRKYLLEQFQAPLNRTRKITAPKSLKPLVYTPVEYRQINSGTKLVDAWPEPLGDDIYGELVSDSLLLLSKESNGTNSKGKLVSYCKINS